jgi:hypothetical protein
MIRNYATKSLVTAFAHAVANSMMAGQGRLKASRKKDFSATVFHRAHPAAHG